MKTVSLELAKQLKEAGYPQEEGIRWYNRYIGNFPEKFKRYTKWELLDWQKGGSEWENVLAPTADEILDLLPRNIVGSCWRIGPTLAKVNSMSIEYGEGINWQHGKTLADAAANMWLFLKEENLL